MWDWATGIGRTVFLLLSLAAFHTSVLEWRLHPVWKVQEKAASLIVRSLETQDW